MVFWYDDAYSISSLHIIATHNLYFFFCYLVSLLMLCDFLYFIMFFCDTVKHCCRAGSMVIAVVWLKYVNYGKGLWWFYCEILYICPTPGKCPPSQYLQVLTVCSIWGMQFAGNCPSHPLRSDWISITHGQLLCRNVHCMLAVHYHAW